MACKNQQNPHRCGENSAKGAVTKGVTPGTRDLTPFALAINKARFILVGNCKLRDDRVRERKTLVKDWPIRVLDRRTGTGTFEIQSILLTRTTLDQPVRHLAPLIKSYKPHKLTDEKMLTFTAAAFHCDKIFEPFSAASCHREQIPQYPRRSQNSPCSVLDLSAIGICSLLLFLNYINIIGTVELEKRDITELGCCNISRVENRT